MAKKEKTPEELYANLLTKLKNVFKKDCWIINNYYIVPGKESDEELPSMSLCSIDPKYKVAVSSVLGDHVLVYIDDVAAAKLDPLAHAMFYDEGYDFKRPEEIHVFEYVDRVKKIITDADGKWKMFVDNKELVEKLCDVLFGEGSFFKLQSDIDDSCAIISKAVFPMITMKSIDTVAYCFCPFREDLNVLCIDFQYEPFQMYSIYGFAKIGDIDHIE